MTIRKGTETFVVYFVTRVTSPLWKAHSEDTIIGRAPTLVAAIQGADSVLEELLPCTELAK